MNYLKKNMGWNFIECVSSSHPFLLLKLHTCHLFLLIVHEIHGLKPWSVWRFGCCSGKCDLVYADLVGSATPFHFLSPCIVPFFVFMKWSQWRIFCPVTLTSIPNVCTELAHNSYGCKFMSNCDTCMHHILFCHFFGRGRY